MSAKDLILLSIYSVLWTLFIAGVTIGMFYLADLDSRNDFWGDILANIGVLVIPIYGWPAGICWLWSSN